MSVVSSCAVFSDGLGYYNGLIFNSNHSDDISTASHCTGLGVHSFSNDIHLLAADGSCFSRRFSNVCHSCVPFTSVYMVEK